MSKSIRHIIPMLIQIEENFSRLYHNIAVIDGQYNPQLKAAALVLTRQEKDHADYYRRLLEEMAGSNITVEDGLFYNIQSILETFKQGIRREDHKDIKSLLNYAISFEQQNSEVLVAIKTHVKGLDEGSQAFEALLDQLIKAELKHSNTLAGFLPKSQ